LGIDVTGADYQPDQVALGGEPTHSRKDLPIFEVIPSIDFSKHFLIIGDVGTGKSTVTPVHEFELLKKSRQMVIREPSRAACNALYYSLEVLYPGLKGDLSIITKDTKLNLEGKIKIVTDGVLLRMLAESSIVDSSIYFDESHQMSSQLELCMSLAMKQETKLRNLFRVMSATIDPGEFLSFLGIRQVHRISGRVHPVSIDVQVARNLDDMFGSLTSLLYTLPKGESWLIFLPTRRLVEKYASTHGGVYIHGGLDGSEINRIQSRAELDKNLRIFATNVIASSVNIYVDNVLVFNEVIDSKDRFGQKTLKYDTLDSNSLLQMIGRVGRFKPGRAVVLTETPIPRRIAPTPVRKALETETPFDLVLLMSKYGLKFSELQFMSRVNQKEVSFADNWLMEIGAIDRKNHEITLKGLLMSEIPYEPDFAHMISTALVDGDYLSARFFLACGAFGDSLNHAYKTDREVAARELLYAFDRSNELNIKAHLLKGYSNDEEGRFKSRLLANGVFLRFVEEALKNYISALDSLNDLLESSKRNLIPSEVVTDPEASKLVPYLEECLSFERFNLHEKTEYDLRNLTIEGPFYARGITMNYRRILFDVVALKGRKSKLGRRSGTGRQKGIA
jgi:hypothetical protein